MFLITGANRGLLVTLFITAKQPPIMRSTKKKLMNSFMTQWMCVAFTFSRNYLATNGTKKTLLPSISLTKTCLLGSAVRSTMADHHWEITWKTNIDGVSITKWHFVDGQSQEIVKEINQIGQDISRLWGDTAKVLPKLINQLQQKKDELDKATERALAITADAVLKNYR